jgi:BON domain
VAEKDEPRREELFPEWTTRPHAVHTVEEPAPPPAPATKDRSESLRGVIWLLVTGAAVVVGFYFMGKQLTRFLPPQRSQPLVVAPDVQIEELARDRLRRDPELRDLGLTVVVQEQIVTVSGRVPDDATREKVLNRVRMVPNASGVIDRLIIGDARK